MTALPKTDIHPQMPPVTEENNVVRLNATASHAPHARPAQQDDVYTDSFGPIGEFAKSPHSPPRIAAHDAQRKQIQISPSMHETLMPDEEVIAAAHLPKVYIVMAFLNACLIFLFGVITSVYIIPFASTFQSVAPQDDGSWTTQSLLSDQSSIIGSQLHALLSLSPLLSVLAFYIGGASACLFFIWRMLQRWTMEMVVTNRRLLFRHGVFYSNFNRIDLRQIFQAEVDQSFLGKILGNGSIFLFTTPVSTNTDPKKDERNISLPVIDAPHRFSSAIEGAKRILRVEGD